MKEFIARYEFMWSSSASIRKWKFVCININLHLRFFFLTTDQTNIWWQNAKMRLSHRHVDYVKWNEMKRNTIKSHWFACIFFASWFVGSCHSFVSISLNAVRTAHHRSVSVGFLFERKKQTKMTEFAKSLNGNMTINFGSLFEYLWMFIVGSSFMSCVWHIANNTKLDTTGFWAETKSKTKQKQRQN